MGDAVEKLVGLAGMERVSGYTRTSSLGNVVHVDAYTRSPRSMSAADITNEVRSLSTGDTELSPVQARNRLRSLANEVAARKRAGAWGDGSSTDSPTSIKGGHEVFNRPRSNSVPEGGSVAEKLLKPLRTGGLFDHAAQAEFPSTSKVSERDRQYGWGPADWTLEDEDKDLNAAWSNSRDITYFNMNELNYFERKFQNEPENLQKIKEEIRLRIKNDNQRYEDESAVEQLMSKARPEPKSLSEMADRQGYKDDAGDPTGYDTAVSERAASKNEASRIMDLRKARGLDGSPKSLSEMADAKGYSDGPGRKSEETSPSAIVLETMNEAFAKRAADKRVDDAFETMRDQDSKYARGSSDLINKIEKAYREGNDEEMFKNADELWRRNSGGRYNRPTIDALDVLRDKGAVISSDEFMERLKKDIYPQAKNVDGYLDGLPEDVLQKAMTAVDLNTPYVDHSKVYAGEQQAMKLVLGDLYESLRFDRLGKQILAGVKQRLQDEKRRVRDKRLYG